MEKLQDAVGRGCQLSIQLFRKLPRIASLLMLSSSKTEEVSQTCFAFDVVRAKNGEVSQKGFLCCQLWKWRRSRRIALLSTLPWSKNEEVSQKGFPFDVVNFEN